MKCGNCTLCCELLDIPWMNSPHSEYCLSCDIGKGCKIYETAPKECINYNCEYLLGEDVSIELRPDNTGVIFERITTKIYIALNHYKNPRAYKNKIVFDYIKKLNKKGITVVITSYTKEPKKMFLANNHTQDGVHRVLKKLINGSTKLRA